MRKNGAFKILRDYSSYSEYIEHQREKTLDPIRREKWFGEEWDLKLSKFKECFKRVLGVDLSGKQCIGIGARTGQEVQAFKDLGADAIGIDIVPCEPLVVQGDMHDIPFPDNSFDIVFSNSVDHSFYPEKLVEEVQRVVKSEGLVLLHVLMINHIDKSYLGYNVCYFHDSKNLIKLFEDVEVLVDRVYNRNNEETIQEILLRIIK